VGAVVDEVLQVLEQAQGFVAAGDGGNALVILEAIPEAYVADWMELDDSNGEASAFFEDLGTVWTEAVLTADLTARERRTWAEKLARWQNAVDDYGVDEAAKYVPYEQLALSPQCGFASVAEGNLLSPDEQRRKLALVVEIAQHV
jgi:hypothetical protein